MNSFLLIIITPHKEFLRKEITFLEAKSDKYNLGITANHSPIISTLIDGKITIKTSSGSCSYNISQGVLKMDDNHTLTIIVDSILEV